MDARRPTDPIVLAYPDALLEAFVELARSAIASDRAATERRAKMTIVGRPTRGGRAA